MPVGDSFERLVGVLPRILPISRGNKSRVSIWTIGGWAKVNAQFCRFNARFDRRRVIDSADSGDDLQGSLLRHTSLLK